MVLFDIYFKCSLNVSVNSRCFCDDARKTLSLLKHKGEWQIFFSFSEKNIFETSRKTPLTS